MPVQTGKSNVLAKVQNKLKAALAAHANDETDYGFQRIPAGITNGTAQLTTVTFGEYKSGNNAGKPFCRMAGVVVEPREIATKGAVVPVAGMQTSLMVPLCDTQGRDGVVPMDDNVAKLLNEFRKLGIDTAGATDIEALASTLQEAAPYFRFSTRPRKNQQTGEEDGVWEDWYGSKGLENYTPPDADAVDDQTEAPARPAPKPSTNGAVAHNPAPAPTNRLAKKPAPPPEPAEDFDEFGDLDSLVGKADDGDADAATALEEMAEQAGVPTKAVKDAANWGEVADLIRGAGGDAPAEDDEAAAVAAEEEEAEAEPFVPEVGSVYLYRPVVKGKAGKPVEVEVTAVQHKAQTATAKNLDDAKLIYKAVPWAALSENG